MESHKDRERQNSKRKDASNVILKLCEWHWLKAGEMTEEVKDVNMPYSSC